MAGPLLARTGDAATRPLRSIATEGPPPARAAALRLLHDRDDERPWAEERAGADRATSVRALLAEWAQRADHATTAPGPTVERPVIDWAADVGPVLSAHVGERAWAMREQRRRAIEDDPRSGRQSSQVWDGRMRTLAEEERSDVERVLQALADGIRPPVGTRLVDQSRHVGPWNYRQLVREGVRPETTALLAAWTGGVVDGRDGLAMALDAAFDEAHRASEDLSLLHISTMLDELGYDGGRLVADACCRSWDPLGREWAREAVTPFVAVHLDKVLAVLGRARQDWHLDALAPYSLLAALDPLPGRAVDALLEVALGTRKSERRAAQDCLSGAPGIEPRLLAALTDGRGEIRAAAAHWLARLGWPSALPALEAAVGREKQDVARGALLDALEALGQPVEKYLDRDALDHDAAKAVAKGLPKDLAWFPWSALPRIRWADSGRTLPVETLQWFLAQAVRGKSPAPNAVLRKYAALLEPADREELGQTVLEAWIAHDLLPIDRDEALARAGQEAHWLHRSILSSPEWHRGSPHLGRSEAEITAAMLPGFLRVPRGSAASSKGILAVVAATAGRGAAPVVQRYLQEWYGTRLSQGKALVEMLAWIEHPSATQLMLSVGSRFRTKGIQDEAIRQATALAERRGWTVDELADRTIPTAGLDEHGVLELSYGERVFVARLQPDLTLALAAPDGTPLKALPAPRVSDDTEAAASAKKQLTAARKELKAVVSQQSDRLYEALCTGRTWPVDDWSTYLRAHPVVGHVVQRLVWTAVAADGQDLAFRPLDDGTLSDVTDGEVVLPDDARVRLAHDSLLTPEDVLAWREHLADYEVVPPFQQLGKGSWTPSDDQAAQAAITEFRGHLVEAFALRGRADRLGYSRGPAEDGGWFMTYLKRLPSLAMQVEVLFSGNYLPEENRTVALHEVSFGRLAPDGTARPVRLGDVPPVLLSEAYADLRSMAADGTGYDADWERKVQP